ncbi:MAG: hypothetical protein ACRCZF_17385, partial [Gemmataceae bacterium]
MRLRSAAILCFTLVGCQRPMLVTLPGTPRPSVHPMTGELTKTDPGSILPAMNKLPALTGTPPTPPLDGGQLLGLAAEDCAQRAAQHATVGNWLDATNARPQRLILTPGDCPPAREPVLQEARYFAAIDARNRAAGEALDRYFQLCDAVARASIATESLARFDRLGPELDKLRAAKLPAPSFGEIERQRLKLLADAEQAQAGIAQLNI